MIAALLARYGYAVLFLGVAVEGDAFLLAASYLAHRGMLRAWLVVACAVAANTATDVAYFLIARARGRAWLERRHGHRPRSRRLLALMERHAGPLLVVSRFAYGLRILIPAACGVLTMGALRFAVLDLVAGTVWAVTVVAVGMQGAAAVEAAATGLHHAGRWIVLGAVLVPAALLGARAALRAVRPRELRASDLHALVPAVVGLMGLVNLASAIWPRASAARVVAAWLPLEVIQRSRPLMLFAGIALLQVTRNLGRRKAAAWWVSVGALAVSILSHIGRGLDLQHSAVAAALLAYLVCFRRWFDAASDRRSVMRALWMVPVLAGAVLLYGVVGLIDLRGALAWPAGDGPWREALRSGLLVAEPSVTPLTEVAARFLGSLQIAGWLARLYLLVLLLRPVVLRVRTAAVPLAEAIVAARGRTSLSAFALGDHSHALVTAEGRALVAYATHGAVALACGDPIAAPADVAASVREFAEHCRRNGWTPSLYEAGPEHLDVYRRLGYRALKIAEEALIDPRGFDLAGGKRAGLRAMVNKMRRAGLSVERYDRASARDAETDAALAAISAEWLAGRKLAEMGFTMGRFALDALDRAHVFVARSAHRVEAFCTWRPYDAGRAAVLDLMRRRGDAPSGVMDLLLAEGLRRLGDAGLSEASLANAPLASVEPRAGALEHGIGLVFAHLGAVYGYKNLFQFKKKFAPRWQPRYLVYPRGAALPSIALALTGVHGGGGMWRIALRTVVPRAA
jgi:phosphatidylglycerol lysyltransferase